MQAYEAYFSRYVELIGNGPQHKGRCPRPERHRNGDRNPSASYNLERGLIYCHGCGLGGHVKQLARELGWGDPPGDIDAWQNTFRGYPIARRYPYTDGRSNLVAVKARVDTSENGHRSKTFFFHDLDEHPAPVALDSASTT